MEQSTNKTKWENSKIQTRHNTKGENTIFQNSRVTNKSVTKYKGCLQNKKKSKLWDIGPKFADPLPP